MCLKFMSLTERLRGITPSLRIRRPFQTFPYSLNSILAIAGITAKLPNFKLVSIVTTQVPRT